MIPIESVATVCFSPTGTSRKVAESIAKGLSNATPARYDATHGPVDALLASEVVVAAVPVYGGKVPPTAVERLKGVRGSGATPAVAVVVYGNRAFEGAARQLADLLTAQGFRVVAAAAFVGEHSYSTDAAPIAPGRPDAADLTAARAFGRAVADKLAVKGPQAVDVSKLPHARNGMLQTWRFVRFVLRYRRSQKKNPSPAKVECDAERCTRCGRCVALCPVEAIAKGDQTRTDTARCIRCCACVKGCPQRARSYASPFAQVLSRNFIHRKSPSLLL